MERLMEDALHIHGLLPWIESDEDIINFMRKIPLDKSHLRNQITLRYFLKKRDSSVDQFENDIENDTRDIVAVIPGTAYYDIKNRLTILGNMPNRKEVVLRQLLHKKPDLDGIVREIDAGCLKKRKSDLVKEEPNLKTNEKIKMRKLEEETEQLESSKMEKINPVKWSIVDPLKATSAVVQSSSKPSSSTTSFVTSSISHSEISTPDSTISTPIADDLAVFMEYVNEGMRNIQSSAKGDVLPLVWEGRNQPTSTNNKDYDFVTASMSNHKRCKSMNCLNPIKESSENSMNKNKEIDSKHIATLNLTEEEILKGNMSNNDSNIGDESAFNLVELIHEVSQYPKQKIEKLCRHLKWDIYKKPAPDKFNYILNVLYDNEIASPDKSDTAEAIATDFPLESDSETEEYSFVDETFEQIEHNLETGNVIVKQPSGKEFKLKMPVLNVGKSLIPDALSPPKPLIPPVNLPNPIIKPSRFNFPNAPPIPLERNVIPAMPRPYLDKQQAKKAPKETLPQSNWLPVDLTGPEELRCIDLVQDEAGPSTTQDPKTRVIDESLVLRLIEMFPEASSDYIRDVCDGKTWPDFNDIVTEMLSAEDYPKRPQRIPSPVKEVDPQEQFQIVKELLPDADPDYLRMQCDKYTNDEKGLKEFINQAVELKDYPTMKEYLRKQQLSAQQKQYTTEFSIEKFIELFPDPAKTFKDPSRVIKMDQMTSHYIAIFFRNKYTKLSARIIQQILVSQNYKPVNCNERFSILMATNQSIMKSKRKTTPLPDNLQNIPLLQELAYISHKDEIEKYLIDKQKKEEFERLETKKMGLMQTCQCCYDEEVMPKDTFSCPNGCEFCKDCIQKSCEVAFGEGKLVFPCLADCSSEFTLQTLQNVLPPKMFSKVAQKKAVEEIKAAGIEDLATCPFCDFATIPNEADKIFRCLNPDCMKESCRLCNEPNHIPLKCEEVEKDEHVKARTHVEDAMTKALIRNCWKCGTSFFKEEGCNKMTCSCGAQMCYICKKPVKDYTHFNGIGGDKFNLCPLYSDTTLVNQDNVLKAAAAAKEQIDPSKLKVDPTADIATHYSNRRKKLPREPHIEQLDVIQQQVMLDRYHRPRHHRHHRAQHYPARPEVPLANLLQLQAGIRFVEQMNQVARNLRRD